MKDDLGRDVALPPQRPGRIVSLCPSITETLYALCGSGAIVGRTRYCIHPAGEVQGAAVVGGTKQVDFDRIKELRPDLIIAEKEENPKEMVEQLAQDYPVYVFDVNDYGEALRMIRALGAICGREREALSLARHIEAAFGELRRRPEGNPHPRVAYLIWRKPYMAAGSRTFIHSMLEKCGFVNIFAHSPDRYPEVDVEELIQAKPDFILLSSEPFPFSEEHVREAAQQIPDAVPLLVDGEMFSWYGARMAKAPDYFHRLIHAMGSRPM